MKGERWPLIPVSLLGALALSCLLAFSLPGRKSVSPVIAAGEGYALLRGAPITEGRETVVKRKELLAGTLLLVSPAHPLPIDFPLPDTRAVHALVGSYLPAAEDTALRKEAIYALCAMETEHPLTGSLRYENGAVSAAQQEQLRRDAFERFRQIVPLTQALERSRAAVPGGGESEHQTGWAVDVSLTGPLSMGQTDPLLRTEAGKWLAENAWRYGFIRRYGSEEEEGACEGIHLRYVGAVHAAAMHILNVSLEDYWALLRKEGSLTLLRDGEPAVYLYCTPCSGDWAFPLPEGASASFSADNTGWAAAAVRIMN